MRPSPQTAMAPIVLAMALAVAFLLCPAPAPAQDGQTGAPPAQDGSGPAQATADPAGLPDPVREGALEEAGSPEAVAAAPGTPAPGSGPKIRVLDPGPMFNGGVSEPGSRLTHEFVLENVGGDPLSIKTVVPGCGCTVASYDSFIAPGRTGKVTVTMDVYREWAGQEYLKVVTVLSNDPENPRMRLALKGRVGMGMSPVVTESPPGIPEDSSGDAQGGAAAPGAAVTPEAQGTAPAGEAGPDAGGTPADAPTGTGAATAGPDAGGTAAGATDETPASPGQGS